MVHASYRTVRGPRHSESECENCGVSGVAENSLKYSEIRRAWAFNALIVRGGLSHRRSIGSNISPVRRKCRSPLERFWHRYDGDVPVSFHLHSYYYLCSATGERERPAREGPRDERVCHPSIAGTGCVKG